MVTAEPKVQLVLTVGVPVTMFEEQSAETLAGQVMVGAAFAIVIV